MVLKVRPIKVSLGKAAGGLLCFLLITYPLLVSMDCFPSSAEQWFSTRGNLGLQGTVGNTWRPVWLSQLRACYWHRVGRDQGCSRTCHSPTAKDDLTPNIDRAEVEKHEHRASVIKQVDFRHASFTEENKYFSASQT